MPDQKLSGDSFEAAYETLAEVARGGSGLEKTPYTHTHTHTSQSVSPLALLHTMESPRFNTTTFMSWIISPRCVNAFFLAART